MFYITPLSLIHSWRHPWETCGSLQVHPSCLLLGIIWRVCSWFQTGGVLWEMWPSMSLLDNPFSVYWFIYFQSWQVPVAAAVYYEDMYVNFKLVMETASQIAGIRLWITNEFMHSGLRDGGSQVFDHLMGILSGKKPLFWSPLHLFLFFWALAHPTQHNFPSLVIRQQ